MPDEESLKLGLPVIQALAAEVELRRPAGGGTEVRMAFATPGSRLPDRGDGDQAGEAPSLELLPAIGPVGERPELIAAATIAIAPDRLARRSCPAWSAPWRRAPTSRPIASQTRSWWRT